MAEFLFNEELSGINVAALRTDSRGRKPDAAFSAVAKQLALIQPTTRETNSGDDSMFMKEGPPRCQGTARYVSASCVCNI